MSTKDTPKRFSTHQEVLETVRASKSTVFRLIREKEFPAPVKICSKLLFYTQEIEDYLSNLPRVEYKYRPSANENIVKSIKKRSRKKKTTEQQKET